MTRLARWIALWLLEGQRCCAGCREVIRDDFEHDFCTTPPDVHESVAFSLVERFSVEERKLGARRVLGRLGRPN